MIIKSNRLSAEEFIEKLVDLPDGGRWTELCLGEICVLEPPDDNHGNVIYHLSQALAQCIMEQHGTKEQQIKEQEGSTNVPTGYACFDQGLIVSRNPDTIQFPSISYFVTDHLFETTDHVVTEKCPELIIEVASTPCRRKNKDERVKNYLELGTKVIWTIDTIDNNITVCEKNSPNLIFSGEETVASPAFLPQLSVQVSHLFKNPDWYK